MSQKPKIIVVLGPTASGKSDLAVKLAKKLGGEVISADSRQVYRGMDIGTGKITKKEMCGIPHHLLDVASPRSIFTVSKYKKRGEHVIRDILRRGKVPIICGGTGFYISALVDGIVLPDIPPNTELRKDLSQKTTTELFTLLTKLDPVFAKKIDRNNPVRLIRAIEIAQGLGRVPEVKIASPYTPLYIGTSFTKDELAKRIHKRLYARMKHGMMAEMKKLHKGGLSLKRMEELGLEYRFGAYVLAKKLTESEMLPRLETAIIQYAKRQMTWFKRNPHIIWLSPAQKRTATLLARKFLKD